MAEIKKAEAVVKPVATIKNPTFITEVKTPELKDTTAETKKAPAKKATAKKTTTKKATAKKTTTKKAASTAKKATATKPNVMIEIQYSYKHISNEELVQKSLDNYQYDLKGDPSKVKKLSIYVKPQEDKAYYVVDDKISGDIDI